MGGLCLASTRRASFRSSFSFGARILHVTAATQSPDIQDYKAVRLWLWAVAAMVFAMVVVGGATRLMEAGLSITEWKPVTGVLPPLSQAAWAEAFEKYKAIPQYAKLFPEMGLADFKTIFYWEWGHRLLGRLIGAAFALPMVFFWLRGRLPQALKPRLLGLLALGALQGFVGWWMVSSGLVDRVEVAPERLAVHLLLASVTLAALVWLAVGLKPRVRPLEESEHRLRPAALLLLALVLAQIGLGALMAGSRAGLTYNTWPLMDGRLVPPADDLWRLSPWWKNIFENITLIQFDHRMLAYIVLGLALFHRWRAGRVAPGTSGAARARAIDGLVFVQVLIGIATLVMGVPLWAGLAHQAFAMIVLAMASVHLRRLY